MSYSVGDVRRWDAAALAGAGEAVSSRMSVVARARGALLEGRGELEAGWDGLVAEAVLDAVEGEKAHVTRLADGLEDLVDALQRAHAALGPAVQLVRDRIADAEAAGLVVRDAWVEPARQVPGRQVADQVTVDLHVEAIGAAVATTRSLDEHYGREIDEIAGRLHTVIPPEVDRSPIPGPGDPWPGRAADAVTGGAKKSFPRFADDLDPATRGAHALVPLPDDHARWEAGRFRALGRVAGPLGFVSTVLGGVSDVSEGRATAEEAALETGGALGGGAAGGALAGSAAGSVFGPVGTLIGAGIGAAVGAELGKRTVDWAIDHFIRDEGEE